MAFNPAAETARYIDALGPEALQKAADYTSASHWMLLWGLLVSAVVTWIIVRTGILDKVSAKLEKRGWGLRTWLVGLAFFLASAIISLPWGIYQEWGFEKSYGRTSQPLADFLMQDAIGTVISSLLGALFFLGIYALIRKAGKRWWLWSGGLAALAGGATLLLSPVLIEPMFNEYKPLQEGPVKDALVDMAAEAGIPADRIFVYDGSRQSNNFTANVSGLFSSKRIAISDVALKGASQDLREKIFRNMSQRAGEMMREDLESKGPVRLSEVEAQQKQILQIVRRMADEGQIVLGGKGEDSFI